MTGLDITPEEALEIIETYREDPARGYIDMLGATPWPIQIEILEAVFKYREVAVKSCHGTGKSYNAARIAALFLLTHPGSIVVTTAPTWRQVKEVLWRELRTAYANARFTLGPTPNQVSWDLGEDWYAIGLSTTSADTFVGFHADHILVVADEAAGIPETIYEGIRGITSNENAHTLYIGNPTALDGTFYKAFRRPRVKKFTISCWDTPNFKANGITNVDELVAFFTPPEGEAPDEWKPDMKLPYPGLISPTYAYEALLEWGTESPMWAARVLGDFPSQAENTLIPLNLIEQAMDPDFRKEHGWVIKKGNPRLGGDIARFGSDKTVLTPREGGEIRPQASYAKQDTVQTFGRIMQSINPFDWNLGVFTDDIGVGGGVSDMLHQALKDNPEYHFFVTPVNVGLPSSNPDKFFNLRAELYWLVREMFFNHEIALPPDSELASELASIRYEFDAKGRIKIEAKDEIKKRTGKSPDKADSLMLSFADPQRGSWQSAEKDSDPFPDQKGKPIASGLGKQY